MDHETAENAIKNAFDLWINPEVEKRQAAGSVETPMRLDAAQVIFPPEGGHIVRLNEEVRGIAYTKTTRAVEKGDPVFLSDWVGLESFDVAEEDLDNGHFTILLVEDRWFCTFNFLRRRAYCATLLEKALQFLQAAKFAQSSNLNAPAVDNLFSAAELASKVFLLLNSSIKMDVKSHGPIHSGINRERKLNNVSSAFVDLFNSLGQWRQSARYNAGALEDMYLTEDDFELVGSVIDDYQHRCRIATPKTQVKADVAVREMAEDNTT